MNSPYFLSAIAQPLATFVQYKQALSRKYRTEASALRLFDRYLSERDIGGWEGIDQIVVDDFLKSRPRARPRSYNHLVGVLHRFCAWALLQGFTDCNPVSAPLRRETSQQIRYLFDLSDAKLLLELVRSLPDRSRAPHRALVYETVFSLLYGLSLRAGEVAKLKLSDVNFAQDILFIRETKFSKSRIVPLGPRLAGRLRRYIEECHGEKPESEVPLFSFTRRGCIGPGTISQTFHKLLPKLNLPIPPGTLPPRLHEPAAVIRRSNPAALVS